MKDNCIFCKIAAGEIPSYTIYEDNDFKAFMDISPASKGHTILIPKEHADNLFELDETVASKLLPVAARIAIESITKQWWNSWTNGIPLPYAYHPEI